jgi:hypothetical protein
VRNLATQGCGSDEVVWQGVSGAKVSNLGAVLLGNARTRAVPAPQGHSVAVSCVRSTGFPSSWHDTAVAWRRRLWGERRHYRSLHEWRREGRVEGKRGARVPYGGLIVSGKHDDSRRVIERGGSTYR